MNRRILTDLHTHTNISPDAQSSPEEMCERAAQLELAAYAITDHCDCNLWLPADEVSESPEKLVDRDMYGSRDYSRKSIAAQTELKEKYWGRLNLLCGIELGQPLQNIAVAEEVVTNPALDFIIGSHHQNVGKDDFYWFDYGKLSETEIYALLDKCFEETLAMCEWGKFDVLGHLTYPLRYICGEYGIEIRLDRYEEIIREIFRTLIQNGKGIEINTSGLRQKYGKTLPCLEYIKLYRELGGEIITLGSDAHSCADLGKGIADGIELARQAGFSYTSFFRERKPQFIKIT
jgi:histidinol-phosphatase (PHP family)